MLTVNKYREVLLEEFYLGGDDLTIHRKKDGWRGKYMQDDVVIPYQLCSPGYFGIHIPRTRTTVSYSHLVTLLRGIEIPDDCVIDHIDGDNVNNARSNLRVTTQTVNCRNSKKHKNNTSGYTGINWNKSANSYTVRKYFNGGRQYLGSTQTLEEATTLLASYQNELTASGYTARHGK